jgi:DNA topoisomerase IA
MTWVVPEYLEILQSHQQDYQNAPDSKKKIVKTIRSAIRKKNKEVVKGGDIEGLGEVIELHVISCLHIR